MIQTPYYLIDEASLLRNMQKIERLRALSGAKVLLALKCFATWSAFPTMQPFMDGTTSSSLFELRLGREKFGKETHAYSVAWADTEIEEAISAVTDQKVRLSFTPLLAPLPRGIIASVSIRISKSSTEELHALFSKFYENENFVKILPIGQWPQTNSVLGSNGAHLQVAFDDHIGRAVVVVAIDNLGKGAAGQAIQNANLIAGFTENAGLTALGTK